MNEEMSGSPSICFAAEQDPVISKQLALMSEYIQSAIGHISCMAHGNCHIREAVQCSKVKGVTESSCC